MLIPEELQKQLNAKYNPEGSALRNIQLKELEILIKIDEICRNNGIKYWLTYGTLLGAIRHGGFIPWDDDIDIEMEKNDYKRFIKIVSKSLLKSNLILQTHYTDKEYVHQFCKIRDPNSILIVNNPVAINYKYKGYFIDIFPVEYSSSLKIHSLCVKLQTKYLYRLQRILNPKKRKIAIFIGWNVLSKMIFPMASMIEKLFSKDYIRCCQGIPFLELRNKKDITELVEVNFEGYKLWAPKNYDSYLKSIFGDYIKLPPESQRKFHILEVLESHE